MMTNGYGFSCAVGGYLILPVFSMWRIKKYAEKASAVTIIQLINWNSMSVLRARFFELSRSVKQKPAADNQGDPQNELKNHKLTSNPASKDINDCNCSENAGNHGRQIQYLDKHSGLFGGFLHKKDHPVQPFKQSLFRCLVHAPNDNGEGGASQAEPCGGSGEGGTRKAT